MTLRTIALAAAMLAAMLPVAGSAQSYPGDPGGGYKLGMEQQNNSGEIGTVTLFNRYPKTLVVLDISNFPAGRQQPAHIHRGTCDNLNPAPVYPLKNVVNGRSSTLVNAPMDKLLSGNYSVNVHSSTTNLKRYVSCGHLYRS